jgi:predicted ribosome quality control (RQC) complex YloA/Tae2 family protein
VQNNYYFLKKLTDCLKAFLLGWRLAECYSQNKDELVMGFMEPSSGKEFYIRALLRPDFCCLSFPERLNRAKKNSVDIFPELVDLKVSGVHQFINERAFLLELTNDRSLLFKMHGNRSNIILCKNGKPEEIFNSRLQQDINIELSSLDRPMDQNYPQFIKEEGNYKKLFPTFGKTIKEYLDQHKYDRLLLAQKWELIQEVLKELNAPEYYILDGGMPEFSLLRFKAVQSEYDDPLIAISEFYIRWLSGKKFVSRKTAAIKTLSKEINKDISYISKSGKKLAFIESENNYRQWADLLMANMHMIKTGEKEVTLENFYQENKPVRIPLNPMYSPQKNAERFYQKAKNQHKQIKILQEGIQKREQVKSAKEQQLEEIQAATDFNELEELLPSAGKKKKVKEKQEVSLPYHHFTVDGYDVLVGKSARHNDILLKQYTNKDDLWLHARNATGSHVIIRQKNKEKIPAPVIEKAARLAAYNSKRKTDSLCPVIVTERKYVRKRKGDKPGAVVVDREEVIMVEPSIDV